jgi:uncharacterized protein YutE (UPF0331/DUF86 family)
MVDRDLVTAKLAELMLRISRVRAKCRENADALDADQDALDLVSFNLMLAVQSCTDIACHIIADEKWPTPTNQASAFNRLRDNGVITPPTAASLCKAIGLRNIVAHGYAGINAAMVYAAATRGVADLETFAHQIASWLNARSSG